MPLTSVDRLISWANEPEMTAGRQMELDRCCAAASRIICRITGRNAERVTRSLNLSGDSAGGRYGEVLLLPAGDRPILHVDPDHLLTVTENGVSLVISDVYDTDADVMLVGANADMRPSLVRIGGGWACGTSNIAVAYECGWSLDDANDTQPAPSEVVQLANAIAWMLFVEPAWLGKLNMSDSGASVAINDKLTSWDAFTLSALTVR